MGDAEISSLTVSLMLGTTSMATAPLDLVQALRTIEVVQGTRCPSGFRLTFTADRFPPVVGPSPDYTLLGDGLLAPFVRVQIVANPKGSTAIVLIDGFITRQELTVEGESSVVTVIGEDVSVKMDLFEVAAEYPSLTDSAIVSQILGNYSSLGITPSVTAPTGEAAPQNWVPQQNSTDRYYLQMLAARHAYQFYIQPGSTAGKNTAYWGPPVTTGDRQDALTANMRGMTNVKRLSASYDALAATVTYGQVLDLTQSPAVTTPVAIGSATQVPGLSSGTALPSNASSLATTPSTYSSDFSTLAVRGTLLYHAGLTVTDAQSLAQAKTNRSVQEVVVVEGELDVDKYGAVLTAPGLVDLRGVGQTFDGTYYVKQVTHVLTQEDGKWSYAQRFVLTRGGTGATITEVEDV